MKPLSLKLNKARNPEQEVSKKKSWPLWPLIPDLILHTVIMCLVRKSLGKRGLMKGEAGRLIFSKKWQVTLTSCISPTPIPMPSPGMKPNQNGVLPSSQPRQPYIQMGSKTDKAGRGVGKPADVAAVG